MIKETAVWVLYMKGMYATTYPLWVYTSYKYEPLTKIYTSTAGQRIVSNIQFKFPTVFKLSEWLYMTSESFAGSVVRFVKNGSLIDQNKYIGSYVKDICPQKLTRACIHATVTCKLLFPVYGCFAYYLTQKSFENDKKKIEY